MALKVMHHVLQGFVPFLKWWFRVHAVEDAPRTMPLKEYYVVHLFAEIVNLQNLPLRSIKYLLFMRTDMIVPNS